MSIITYMVLAASTPQAEPAAAAPDRHQVMLRLGEIEREVGDLSTPDRALRSYFHYMNLRSEISCLVSETWRSATNAGSPSHREVTAQSNRVRDSHFSGLARRVMQRSYEMTYAECMSQQESYSYEILGVNPQQNSTIFTVLVKNTTPIPRDAVSTPYAVSSRAAGMRLRLDYRLEGSSWTIHQIEEWDSFIETWNPQFNESELLPFYPSTVLPRPL
jgi:hypothetical protein